jgi:hypothetical protein
MSPRLSVVIPARDCLPYLTKAIDSTFPADVALCETRLGARHVIAIVRDASERKRVDQMKNEFVSTVSH